MFVYFCESSSMRPLAFHELDVFWKVLELLPGWSEHHDPRRAAFIFHSHLFWVARFSFSPSVFLYLFFMHKSLTITHLQNKNKISFLQWLLILKQKQINTQNVIPNQKENKLKKVWNQTKKSNSKIEYLKTQILK